MCLYPKIIKNRKYEANKKNGGVVPSISDIRIIAVPVGCGNCIECRRQKAREWQVRLLEDVRENKNGIFITLTFSNESIKELLEAIRDKEEGTVTIKEIIEKGYETDNKIAKIATRRFLERWRKEHKKSLRHWLVTELGHNGTENIHMHGIVWTDKEAEEIKKHWKYGYVWAGTEKGENYVSEKTVNYITKYISKQDEQHKEYKSIILTSSGIGAGYTKRKDSERNKYNKRETKEYYQTRSGHKIAMPTYWRNKIYTEEEREKLWIEKLDKNERWVLGERISTEEGEEDYYKALKDARKKNKRLGYGNDVKNWNRKQYENQRRELMMQKRIEKK